MLLIFLGIGLALIVTWIVFLSKGLDSDDGVVWATVIPGWIISIITITAIIIVVGNIVHGKVIDQEIEIYQNHNTEIETQLEEIIKQYMEHEGNIIDKVSSSSENSSVVLITLYPELKSDALVIKLIDTYQSNDTRLRELELEQLNMTIYKWWLYFG